MYVSVGCQFSGFESLERFVTHPSKRTVSNSSSFCRGCTCEIALATVSEDLTCEQQVFEVPLLHTSFILRTHYLVFKTENPPAKT